MKRTFTRGTLLALALILAGCGTSTSPTNPLNRNQLKVGDLRMVATVNGPSAGIVTFKIGLENGAETTQTLAFSSGQFFDIEITDRSGNVAWRWSHHMYFTQAFWELELGAGEAYLRETTWDLKDDNGRSLPSGAYGCRIWITNTPRDEALVITTSLTI